MNISDFDYNLPSKLIAKYPPTVRGQSRLLVLKRRSGKVTHAKYSDLVNYINPGDVLVLNRTKVIKARLLTKNSKGDERELLLIEKHSKHEDWHQHKAIYRGKLIVGETLTIGSYQLQVSKLLDGGLAVIKSSEDLQAIAKEHGSVPLPPYMKRRSTELDVERYQTTFASQAGSVAAPTASLNFTPEVKQQLIDKGVEIHYITLHVGLGTFLPIRTGSVEDHKMHKEYFEVPKETAQSIKASKQSGRKVFALGTTVTRTLEYVADKLLAGNPAELSGEADIFIYPGYKFKVVDGLITNFHAPRSTVLMMAAAFAGWDNLSAAYETAMASDYSMLSYGDSMIII